MTPIARKILKATAALVGLGVLLSVIVGYLIDASSGTAIWYVTLILGLPLTVVGLVTWLVETIARPKGTRRQE